MKNLKKVSDKKNKSYTQIHRVDSSDEVVIETGNIDVSELENEIRKRGKVK